MAVKEIPTDYRVYLKQLKLRYTEQRVNAEEILKEQKDVINNLYDSIKQIIVDIDKALKTSISSLEEFQCNKYINGTFYRTAKGLYSSKNNFDNPLHIGYIVDIYSLAKKQKDIYRLEEDIKKCDKILNLTKQDYIHILRTFYNKVHERLITKGEGYAFEGYLGWICINRCKISNKRKKLDFNATRLNKEKLIAEGKRLYNKQEAEWCKKNNIPYNAVDPRVYLNEEYCYQIPLLGCKLPNARKFKLKIADYKNRALAGKSLDDIAKDCNNDLIEVCNQPLDLKTKLNICIKLDNMLYTNFIRNENQEPYNSRTLDRKD